MSLSGILGRFETRHKQFFHIFGAKEKIRNFFFPEKNRRFFFDFFTSDFSTRKSFPVPLKTNFSTKNRPKKTIFLSMSKTEDKGYEELAIGNGDTLPISHFGTCHLPSYQPLALKHLLLVPSITKNLISISKLTSDNDVIVEFNSSYYHVKDKFWKEIPLIGTLCNGLYLEVVKLGRPRGLARSAPVG